MASKPAGISDILDTARRGLADDPSRSLTLALQAIAIAPHNADAHRIAALAHRALDQVEEAERAELAAIAASAHDPILQQAAQALMANALHDAEPILRARLKTIPTDVAAIRMLAEVAGRIGRYRDAETLLRRALELAPAFDAARSNLATVLHKQHRTEEALAELDILQTKDADNPAHANLKAATLGRIGEFEEALGLYESVLEKAPKQAKVWMSYGHTLKTVGRQEDSVSAYRSAVSLRPEMGEAWWSLANLKTVRFAPDDVAAMEQALTQDQLSEDDRFHLHFALGKAHEDAADHARAFAHYDDGNRLRRAQLGYNPDELTREIDRAINCFSTAFLAQHRGVGDPSPDPIFIIGMPRAGSTLIEQILASHSQVEGTMELPDIPALAAKSCGKNALYPEGLASLQPDAFAALGQEYLDRTRIQRKEGKPYFIDKLPNNWMHVGFIHLILPNAKIIDARRHPLDCCFSNFKQHFARGQSFSYGLDDMGRYYADYVRLMAHFDAVLPGRVYRVIHERLVDNPETEVRNLLLALGLEFEESCLNFHENKRAVRTASSEQVRRPINRDGMDQWKPYDSWLGPLRAALGNIITNYPD